MNKLGLVRNAAFSLAETVWAGIVLFFLFKFVAAHLGMASLGAWSLVAATMSMSRLADIGIGAALLHFVPTALARDRRKDAAELIETGTVSNAILFALVALAGGPIFGIVLSASVAPGDRAIVLGILPYSLLSLWLSNVALTFLSGLAGAHRYDLRSVVSMLGTAVQLVSAIILIPRIGLMGLIWAQLAQALCALIVGFVALKIVLPELGLIPLRFSFARFRRMFGYGVNLQFTSLASFLFEPTTKLILSHIAGLSMVGFYEMASRLIAQVRSLLANTLRVSVPALAQLYELDRAKAFQGYMRTNSLVWTVAFPVMATLAAFVPAISDLWLGHRSPIFTAYAFIMIVSWTINLTCAPAYFMAMANGRMRWNLWGWALISVLNVVIGPISGMVWGGFGVVGASALALSLGSLLILYFGHRSLGGTADQIFDRPTAAVVLASIGGAVTAALSYRYVCDRWGIAAGITLCAAIMLVAVSPWLWRHHSIVELTGELRLKWASKGASS